MILHTWCFRSKTYSFLIDTTAKNHSAVIYSSPNRIWYSTTSTPGNKFGLAAELFCIRWRWNALTSVSFSVAILTHRQRRKIISDHDWLAFMHPFENIPVRYIRIPQRSWLPRNIFDVASTFLTKYACDLFNKCLSTNTLEIFSRFSTQPTSPSCIASNARLFLKIYLKMPAGITTICKTNTDVCTFQTKSGVWR